MTGFIPNILICGDKSEFLANVGKRAYKIVGEVKFFGEHEGDNFNFFQDGKFLLDGEFHDYKELRNIIGGVEYIVFNDPFLLIQISGLLQNIGCPRSQLVSIREFNNLPTDNFYDFNSDLQLLMYLLLNHYILYVLQQLLMY